MPAPRDLIRRPSFWLIVVLVIVIPTIAYFSSRWLVRELRGPAHSFDSAAAAQARR